MALGKTSLKEVAFKKIPRRKGEGQAKTVRQCQLKLIYYSLFSKKFRDKRRRRRRERRIKAGVEPEDVNSGESSVDSDSDISTDTSQFEGKLFYEYVGFPRK